MARYVSLIFFLHCAVFVVGQILYANVTDFVAGFAPKKPGKDGMFRQYLMFYVQRTTGDGTQLGWHECIGASTANATSRQGTLQSIDYTTCLHTGGDFGLAVEFGLADVGDGAWQLRLFWDLPGPKGVQFGNHIIRASDLAWVPFWGHEIQIYAGPTEFGFVVDQFGQPDPTVGAWR